MDRLTRDDLVRWLQSALRANEHDWTCEGDRDIESARLQAIFDLALQSLAQTEIKGHMRIAKEAIERAEKSDRSRKVMSACYDADLAEAQARIAALEKVLRDLLAANPRYNASAELDAAIDAALKVRA